MMTYQTKIKNYIKIEKEIYRPTTATLTQIASTAHSLGVFAHGTTCINHARRLGQTTTDLSRHKSMTGSVCLARAAIL